ncbi:MAG: glycosyltransferase family 4 protein [Pseudomonadota bacterium]
MGYVWSPLSPSPSGIANYTETLIASDPDFDDLVFVTEQASERDGRRAVAPSETIASEQQSLLQLGNNVHHGYILEQARRGGAIVELHDLSLHHIHTERTLARGDFAGYLKGLEDAEGDFGRRAAFQRVKGFYTPRLDFYLRVNRAICDRAEAVIVHSRWARYQIELQDVSTPIHVIPHYAIGVEQSNANSRTKAEARDRLGLDADEFIILAGGYVTPAKRLDWVITAFEQVCDQSSDVRLIVAGACEWEPAMELIRSSRHASSIQITGYLSDADFDDYTLAADILPLMRFPSAGESSGVAARALGFGKMVIVPEYAAFSDIPDDICEKIQLDEPVVPQIVAAIGRYLGDPFALRRKERRVLDYAQDHLSLEAARADLKEVLNTYWNWPNG